MTDMATSAPTAVSDVSDVPTVVALARQAFDSGRTKPYAWREAQLKALRRLLIDHEDEIAQALDADLGKSAEEFWLTETGLVVSEIDLPSTADWEAAIRECAISAHDAFLRHPWACSLVMSPTATRGARVPRLRYME